jgi:hypothetical protein
MVNELVKGESKACGTGCSKTDGAFCPERRALVTRKALAWSAVPLARRIDDRLAAHESPVSVTIEKPKVLTPESGADELANSSGARAAIEQVRRRAERLGATREETELAIALVLALETRASNGRGEA